MSGVILSWLVPPGVTVNGGYYRVVNELLEGYSWEFLEHPPYSPDLAPCNFHLLPKGEKMLQGRRFEDEDQIQEAVSKSLGTLDKRSLTTVFDRRVHQTEKCRELDGSYVE
ncbi:histone-lysine N-methyltransferase SETMAR-like [Aplysia californica]|uniref:Histone-lysine N-methyltransferase SETMAR-like n=1 Tax=Aplysia californica TaxID=6500 RepID=A0ABM1W298_APLCA|nr:histone-lysine N-methyltransferase SETMAR-like [Aplysia californica]